MEKYNACLQQQGGSDRRDILDTNILFGQKSSRKILLMLSGLTLGAMSHNPIPNNKPQTDFFTKKSSDFLSLKLHQYDYITS